MRGEDSSSDGLGGIGPEVTRSKPCSGAVTMALAIGSREVSRSVSPRTLARPASRCRDGRRKSASISKVRMPMRAKPTAMATLVVLLPSPACALVTAINLGRPSRVE